MSWGLSASAARISAETAKYYHNTKYSKVSNFRAVDPDGQQWKLCDFR